MVTKTRIQAFSLSVYILRWQVPIFVVIQEFLVVRQLRSEIIQEIGGEHIAEMCMKNPIRKQHFYTNFKLSDAAQ